MKFMLGKIRLPIVEDKIEIREGRESSEVKILNGKTVTVMGNKKLTEISYQSYFPKYWTKYVSMIDEIINGDNYIRVNIPKKKINKMMQIVDWSWKPKANGDIDYSIDLKEYNKPQENIAAAAIITSAEDSATVTAFTGTLNGEAREVKTVDPTTYTVKSGDCLCAIARLYNMQWTDLYNDNKDIIGNDPNNIYPGQVLKVRGTSEKTEKSINKINLIKNANGTIIGRR